MTSNIESVKANKLYLQKLCQENDIVCHQEHRLWDFEKDWFKIEFTDFEPFVPCHDSNDNISNLNVPRGRPGLLFYVMINSQTLSPDWTLETNVS